MDKSTPTIEKDGDVFVWRRNALRAAFTVINQRTIAEFFLDNPYEEKNILDNTVIGPPAGKEDRGAGSFTSFELSEQGYIGVYVPLKRGMNPA